MREEEIKNFPEERGREVKCWVAGGRGRGVRGSKCPMLNAADEVRCEVWVLEERKQFVRLVITLKPSTRHHMLKNVLGHKLVWSKLKGSFYCTSLIL